VRTYGGFDLNVRGSKKESQQYPRRKGQVNHKKQPKKKKKKNNTPKKNQQPKTKKTQRGDVGSEKGRK